MPVLMMTTWRAKTLEGLAKQQCRVASTISNYLCTDSRAFDDTPSVAVRRPVPYQHRSTECPELATPARVHGASPRIPQHSTVPRPTPTARRPRCLRPMSAARARQSPAPSPRPRHVAATPPRCPTCAHRRSLPRRRPTSTSRSPRTSRNATLPSRTYWTVGEAAPRSPRATSW
jgi:hypothetical protein